MLIVLAILLSSLSPLISSKKINLVILHSNDLNARFDEVLEDNYGLCTPQIREKTTCIGGFARTAHVVKVHREEAKTKQNYHVLYLFTGNVFTGSVWFRIHKAKIASAFINALKPDAMSIGVREFDYGPEELMKYVEELNTDIKILGSTMDLESVPKLNARIDRRIILEPGGVKIGLVGYISHLTSFTGKVGEIGFDNEIHGILDESEKLKEQGAEIIIVIGCASYSMALQIAREIPNINIVIGGGTRAYLWDETKGPPPPHERKIDGSYPVVVKGIKHDVLVVTTPGLSAFLGRLNITIEGGKILKFDGQPIFMDKKVPQDHEVNNLLKKFEKEVQEKIDKIIGSSHVRLKASFRECRIRECNFGNLITDSYVDYITQKKPSEKYWTSASIAILPATTVKSDIDPNFTGGKITEADLMGARPFNETLVVFSLIGNHLLQVLEYSASLDVADIDSGGYLQLSGLRIVVDKEQPPNSRLISVRVLCSECMVPKYEPLKMDQFYRLIAPRTLLEGMHGHITLLQYHFDSEYFNDISDHEIVKAYMKKHSPIYPQIEGRIVFDTKDHFNSTTRDSFNYIQILFILYCIYIVL